MLEQVCPILPARDFAVTEAFYHSLRFATIYNDGHYLMMNRDGVEIHFFHHPTHDPATCDHGAYLRPRDVDAFSAEVARLTLPHDTGFPQFQPAEDKPWGMREATIWDPDGSLIRVGQEIK